MPTNQVKIGGYYIHDKTKKVLRVEAAGSPFEDDKHGYVKLIDNDNFTKQNCFVVMWRGTWKCFMEQWSECDTSDGKQICFCFNNET